jgi:hypothetical protein
MASAEDTDELDVSNMTLTALKGSTSETFVKALLAKAKYIPAVNYDDGVKMVLDGKENAMVTGRWMPWSPTTPSARPPSSAILGRPRLVVHTVDLRAPGYRLARQ